ncbi:glucan endo-1,3-beta-glucosidase 8-like [Nicotiana sylvestris]|uniref:Glucan endo-1,3-beta-glucosidase 8-like n=2 Tax=Nicotiana TaxID=4085 RepID=A0A1S4BHH5_TOBAC|nr:PREDICTED: glucan endo-1,3-beta-glucosidase 8-like [Nicotiana sylvestris]XP_009802006.1 PREDICTED: glucan endo-1,3-beta-glucosidase 8-like [Nicotiana sylvestris]XP_016488305.1 PREDICTED: glucan endo-1,3-beta-glucosidase 8-like [Nicotiana tabacum]XP_016488306.1 PREDICTED: glucan endo-1,3-beta-glucosidase 8-like [Nicotiana tabacum]
MRLNIGMCFMVLFMATRVNSFVGITWGRQQSQQLVPSMVVDLLLQNKIPALRLMTSANDIIEIFSATNISISITLGHQTFNLVNRKDLAYIWVNDRVKEPVNKGVNIVEVTIGSEPFSRSFFRETAKTYQLMNVIKLVRGALNDMGLGYIRTTTSHGMDVLKLTKIPSEADFRDDIKTLMLESLEFFNQTGTPFLLNMFPIQMVREILECPMEFAFFDNKSEFKIQDGNITYRNAVELMIDTVAWAITKAGYPNMKIMIGQIGWPTDGYPHANIENARRFHKGLLKFLASNKGTPLRPGPIDVFLHSLSDENEFRAIFGAFQRHWGIYEADGNPKYKIDFSLQDRDIYPTQAKGIVTMPNRWCKFDGDNSDKDLVNKYYNFACQEADCTRLEKGGSCDGLSDDSKISYAFNAYFQKEKQKVEACDFDGLGEITAENPSVGNCEFPIEILALQDQIGRDTSISIRI